MDNIKHIYDISNSLNLEYKRPTSGLTTLYDLIMNIMNILNFLFAVSLFYNKDIYITIKMNFLD